MKSILIAASLLFSLIAFDQSFTLEGRIATDTDGVKIGHITVFSLPDSSLIKGCIIDTVYFSFTVPANKSGEYYANLSVTEYSDTLIHFQNANGADVNLGIITLQRDINLDMVEVVYRQPLYVRNIDGIEVNVAGTTLETLNNLFDILKASPGIMSPDNESIEMVGKGAPLIFIDKQPVLSNEELKAVPASMVDRIEIISNPSAKYRAQGRTSGVIEVYTKNFRLEGFNATINTEGGIISQVTPIGSLGLGLSLKKRKFSLSGFVYSRYLEQTNYGYSSRILTDGSERTATWDFTDDYQNFSQNIDLKASFLINENQTISGGILASGYINSTSSHWYGDYLSEGVPQTHEDVLRTIETTWLNNNAFLNYLIYVDTNKSSLEFNLNYQLKIDEYSESNFSDYINYTTNSLQEFDLKNYARNRPNIVELRVSYEHVFDTSGWLLNSGVLYNLVFNNKELDVFMMENEAWVKNADFSNSYEYDEQIGGAYIEITKNWSKISIRAGIRGEITDLEGYSHSLSKQFIDSVYILPFPSASIWYQLNDKLSVTLRYSSGIDRPQFHNFDPFIRITDSLTRFTGNPYLRPATISNAGFDVDVFKKYRVSFDQLFIHNPTTEIKTVEDTTFLYISSPRNSERTETSSLSLGIPLKIKWMDGWTYLNISYSKNKFTDEFTFAETYNFGYMLWSTLNFHLNGNFTITNQVYMYKWASFAYSNQLMYRWNIQLTKRLLNNNLSLSIKASDILAPANKTTEMANDHLSYYTSQELFTDFQVGILYKFGRLKNDVYINESKPEEGDRF